MSPSKNPFSELERMLKRMSKEFEDSPRMFERNVLGSGAVSVDLADHDDELVLTADLPGFAREEITVECTDSRIDLRAEHEAETEDRDENYIRRERSQRSVRRSLDLPTLVDPDGVTASYRNGVLTVTMPKAEPAEGGRTIDIE